MGAGTLHCHYYPACVSLKGGCCRIAEMFFVGVWLNAFAYNYMKNNDKFWKAQFLLEGENTNGCQRRVVFSLFHISIFFNVHMINVH